MYNSKWALNQNDDNLATSPNGWRRINVLCVCVFQNAYRWLFCVKASCVAAVNYSSARKEMRQRASDQLWDEFCCCREEWSERRWGQTWGFTCHWRLHMDLWPSLPPSFTMSSYCTMSTCLSPFTRLTRCPSSWERLSFSSGTALTIRCLAGSAIDATSRAARSIPTLMWWPGVLWPCRKMGLCWPWPFWLSGWPGRTHGFSSWCACACTTASSPWLICTTRHCSLTWPSPMRNGPSWTLAAPSFPCWAPPPCLCPTSFGTRRTWLDSVLCVACWPACPWSALWSCAASWSQHMLPNDTNISSLVQTMETCRIPGWCISLYNLISCANSCQYYTHVYRWNAWKSST